MSLVVDVRITNSAGYTSRIEYVSVRRLEPLDAPHSPEDEIHRYEVTLFDKVGNEREFTNVLHRYGDGPRALATLALEALTDLESEEVSHV